MFVGGLVVLYDNPGQGKYYLDKQIISKALPPCHVVPININHNEDCSVGHAVCFLNNDVGLFCLAKITNSYFLELTHNIAKDIEGDAPDEYKQLFFLNNCFPSFSLSTKLIDFSKEDVDASFIVHISLCGLGHRPGTLVIYGPTVESITDAFRYSLSKQDRNYIITRAAEQVQINILTRPYDERLFKEELLKMFSKSNLLTNRWSSLKEHRRLAQIKSPAYLQASHRLQLHMDQSQSNSNVSVPLDVLTNLVTSLHTTQHPQQHQQYLQQPKYFSPQLPQTPMPLQQQQQQPSNTPPVYPWGFSTQSSVPPFGTQFPIMPSPVHLPTAAYFPLPPHLHPHPPVSQTVGNAQQLEEKLDTIINSFKKRKRGYDDDEGERCAVAPPLKQAAVSQPVKFPGEEATTVIQQPCLQNQQGLVVEELKNVFDVFKNELCGLRQSIQELASLPASSFPPQPVAATPILQPHQQSQPPNPDLQLDHPTCKPEDLINASAPATSVNQHLPKVHPSIKDQFVQTMLNGV